MGPGDRSMKWLTRLFKLLMAVAVLGVALVISALVAVYVHFESELPSTESLSDVQLQVPLRVYTRDGKFIGEFGEKRRLPLSYEQIPPALRDAFLAAEDDRFFEHPGVDYQGLIRAAIQLVLTGERRQGGSTITMQVARAFFLTREKTFTRKLKEILLALRIERELSKETILALYLNKIYLGKRAYGVGAAAQVYYGKQIDELDLAQTAMIAGLPKAPSRFNPIASPERAKARRDYVLGRMLEVGFISQDQLREATARPVTARLYQAEHEVEAPYMAEMVRAHVVEAYGSDLAYTAGLQVYTTLDSRLQEVANRALRNAMQAYDRRHGYRGVVGRAELPSDATPRDWARLLDDVPAVANLVPALVLQVDADGAQVYSRGGERVMLPWPGGLAWARPYRDEDRRGPRPQRPGDVLRAGDLIYVLQSEDEEGAPYWRLAQVPAVEGAFVSLDPEDGAILALVGGYDFYRSKFNRATQARRQPSSGFKAFIYSAALDAGYTPASVINDAPLVLADPSLKKAWRPENYSRKFFGPTRLRVALMKSRNLVSIRLLRAIGVNRARQHCARFGFDAEGLPRNLSLALGTGEVTLLEMARGYAVLANGGYLIDPHFIERIADGEGATRLQAEPVRVDAACELSVAAAGGEPTAVPGCAPRTLSPENQFLMVSMMQDVIQRGTGRRAKALGRQDLAGKTGTTNDQRDAWFNGFNPDLVAIAWVGFDSFAPLGKGEVGGRVALPAWMEYMRAALREVPDVGWQQPEGVVSVRISSGSGAHSRADGTVFELFRRDATPAPSAGLSKGSSRESAAAIAEDLF